MPRRRTSAAAQQTTTPQKLSNELRLVLPPIGMLARDLILGALALATKFANAQIELKGDVVEIRAPSSHALRTGLQTLIELTSQVTDNPAINAYHYHINYGAIRGCDRAMAKLDAPRLPALCERSRRGRGGRSVNAICRCVQQPAAPTNPKQFTDSVLVPDLARASRCASTSTDVVTKCADEMVLPLVVPEEMEATKWFGGWNGQGKPAKIGLPQSYTVLAIAGLAAYTVAATGDTTLLLLPDSAIGAVSLALRRITAPLLHKPRINWNALIQAPQLARAMAAAIATGGARGMRLVELKITGARVEVFEAASSSVIALYAGFAAALGEAGPRLLRILDRDFAEKLAGELNTDADSAQRDAALALNTLAESVLKAATRAETPWEASARLAKQTYMRATTYSEALTPATIKAVRRALRTLWELS